MPSEFVVKIRLELAIISMTLCQVMRLQKPSLCFSVLVIAM